MSTYRLQEWFRADECVNLGNCSGGNLTVILVYHNVWEGGRERVYDYIHDSSTFSKAWPLGTESFDMIRNIWMEINEERVILVE